MGRVTEGKFETYCREMRFVGEKQSSDVQVEGLGIETKSWLKRDSYQIISLGYEGSRAKSPLHWSGMCLELLSVQMSILRKWGPLDAPSLGNNENVKVIPTSAVSQKPVTRDFPLWPRGLRPVHSESVDVSFSDPQQGKQKKVLHV